MAGEVHGADAGVFVCFLLSSFLSLVLMVIFAPPCRALAGKTNTDEA